MCVCAHVLCVVCMACCVVMCCGRACATCVGVGDVADIVDDVGVAVYVVSGVGVCNTLEFAQVRCCDCRGCGCHCGGCG